MHADVPGCSVTEFGGSVREGPRLWTKERSPSAKHPRSTPQVDTTHAGAGGLRRHCVLLCRSRPPGQKTARRSMDFGKVHAGTEMHESVRAETRRVFTGCGRRKDGDCGRYTSRRSTPSAGRRRRELPQQSRHGTGSSTGHTDCFPSPSVCARRGKQTRE